MADAAVSTPPPATPAKKPGKAKKAAGVVKAKSKAKPAQHPPTAEMVRAAIAELKEKSGSSLQAIKKYISANYTADADKLAPFIKKYLRSAVESGALVRTKGKGASGSFKLEAKSKPASSSRRAPKSPKASKPAAPKPKAGGVTKKKAAAKKPAKPKSPAKPKAAKKAPAKPKSPSKAKKSAKPPTKPKSPKPKKAAAKKPAAKKAAAKK